MARKSQQEADAELVTLGQSIGHLVRVGILRALVAAGDRMSPNELSKTLDESLGNVAYHVRRLLELGVLERAGEKPRRGALEHFYRLTPAGRRVGQPQRYHLNSAAPRSQPRSGAWPSSAAFSR